MKEIFSWITVIFDGLSSLVGFFDTQRPNKKEAISFFCIPKSNNTVRASFRSLEQNIVTCIYNQKHRHGSLSLSPQTLKLGMWSNTRAAPFLQAPGTPDFFLTWISFLGPLFYLALVGHTVTSNSHEFTARTGSILYNSQIRAGGKYFGLFTRGAPPPLPATGYMALFRTRREVCIVNASIPPFSRLPKIPECTPSYAA